MRKTRIETKTMIFLLGFYFILAPRVQAFGFAIVVSSYLLTAFSLLPHYIAAVDMLDFANTL